jgi:cytochrome c-type biogenesis protein
MQGHDISLLAAFAAGAVSFLSPCVLPVVPAYLAVLAGGEDGTRRQFVVRTACFFAGFTVVFVAMGATASLLGRLFLEHQDIVRRVGAVFIVLMGLQLAGLLRLPGLDRERRFTPGASLRGPLGAFVLGLAITAGWTPCVGPILAAILAYAGIDGTVGRGILLLTAYSAGFALPFLLFTLLYRRYSARIRTRYRWLPLIQRAAGAVLVATGVLLYFNLLQQVLGLIYGYWPL